MSKRFKSLSDLNALGKELKQQKAALAEAEKARIQTERAQKREADIFRLAVGDVTPLSAANRVLSPLALPQPIAHQRHADEREVMKAAMLEEFDVTTLLDIDESLSYARNGVSRDVVRKLRRGHWITQDEIDLHGLRRDEAKEVLADFLRDMTRRGLRCVRIVHGKGLGSVNKEPVLKKMVYAWLAQKDEVMAFCEAKAVDGGSGAMMVLLKGRS